MGEIQRVSEQGKREAPTPSPLPSPVEHGENRSDGFVGARGGGWAWEGALRLPWWGV
ncbi:MAG TPA: hypothetical protein VFU49_23765 [Ktedonobacteraceae bacterium]|nr:hypothetical protein [Ktedonobacteraceae bacterium]